MTRARDLANIADGTFTATDLNLSGTLDVSGDATFDTNTLFVDVSTNRVGVGTTSPASSLDVTGEIRTDDDVRFTSGARHKFIGGGSGNNLELGTYSSFNTVRNIGLVIDSAGNVGIGTTSPTGKLHVSSAVGADSAQFSDGTYYTVAVRRIPSATGALITGTASSALAFGANNTERMRIDTSGNVGIGTTSPSVKLEVSDNIAIRGGSDRRITLGSSGTIGANDSNHLRADGTALKFNTAGGEYILEQNGSEAMRIDSSGNIGIGTTSPDSIFTVARGGTSDWSAKFHRGSRTDQGIYTDGSGMSFQGIDATNGYTAIRINGNNVDSNSYNHIRFDTYGSERMRIDSSGNVGIGTSSPSNTLEVYDNAVGGGITISGANAPGLTLNDISDSGYAVVSTQNNGDLHLQADPSNASAGTTMNFFVDGSQRMVIDSSGNVGVGRSSPSYRLDVKQGTDGTTAGFAGSTYGIRFDNGGAYSSGMSTIHGVDDTLTGTYQPIMLNGSDVRIGTSANERMRIDSSGQVGIGTSSPAAKLHVNANANNITVDNGLLIKNSNSGSSAGARLALGNDVSSAPGLQYASSTNTTFGSNALVVYQNNAAPVTFWTSNTERMRITSGGNLLLGKTVTGQVLTNGIELKPGNASYISACGDQAANPPLYLANKAASGTRNLAYFYGTSTLVGSITHNGTNTAYNTSSDARLKENIADAEDAGAKVDAIQVRQFDWKEGGAHQDYGMIAQELMTVAPEAVSGDPESDEMMGVDYSKLVPMMLKEIQSLRARVAQLEGA